MIRVSTLIWIMLVALSGYAMFQVKSEVTRLDKRLVAVNRQIADDRDQMRTLNVEWATLTQPERLDTLSQHVLQLSPIRTLGSRIARSSAAARQCHGPGDTGRNRDGAARRDFTQGTAMSQTNKPDDNPCRPRHFKPVLCAPAPTDGPGRTALEICHTRLIVAGALFVVAFLAIGAQLVDVMELKSPDKATARNHVVEHTGPGRADILDRNGVMLATTLEMPSVYANPKQIEDKDKVAAELAQIFPELTAAKLGETFKHPNLSFVWIKHDLTPRQQLAVNALGEHGLQFINEDRRVYPKGNLFAHVVGFVNSDGKGMAGIEAGLEKQLKADTASPVRLSVDARVQFILRGEILRQMAAFDAKRGFGLVMNVRNGEVLAMTSLPDFDPNNLTAATSDQLYNHATFGVYEMGSVFKIFNTAMLLSSGLATMDTKFDATNPIKIGRFTIHDDHPQRRWLSVAEVFQYSSNIGSAKEAMAAGIPRQEDFLGKLGLLNTPHFELPEVAAPHIPNPWHEVNLMTVAFGHGMSVSLLQMATAVSAIVNGGLLYPPTLRGARYRASRRTRADAHRLGRHAPAVAPGRHRRHRQIRRRTRLSRRRQDRHRRGGAERRLCAQAASVLVRRRLSDQRSAICRDHQHRSAARYARFLWLRHRGLGRGAGRQPHYRAHGAAGRYSSD